MTKTELLAAIQKFFNDDSRSQAETREALMEAVEEIESMIETLSGSE